MTPEQQDIRRQIYIIWALIALCGIIAVGIWAAGAPR